MRKVSSLLSVLENGMLIFYHHAVVWSQPAQMTITKNCSSAIPASFTAIARVPCEVEGHPTPVIWWRHWNYTNISSDVQDRLHYTAEGVLEFWPVQCQDEMAYVCMAVNEAGRAEEHLKIN